MQLLVLVWRWADLHCLFAMWLVQEPAMFAADEKWNWVCDWDGEDCMQLPTCLVLFWWKVVCIYNPKQKMIPKCVCNVIKVLVQIQKLERLHFNLTKLAKHLYYKCLLSSKTLILLHIFKLLHISKNIRSMVIFMGYVHLWAVCVW